MQALIRDNIRLAASIILLRSSSAGPEVFMMQRPGGVDFPDLHVFPGGKVDQQDFLPEFVDGCDEASANAQLGVSGGGLRYWVAAIRECFEEAGVLLARRVDKTLELLDESEVSRFNDYRQQLIHGELSMETLCRQEGLQLAADAMQYFSHWLTPESAPRRFDTRFFIAVMPAGQETAAHAWETADSQWVTPAAALAEGHAGRWQMISPTLVTLSSLAGYAGVSEIRTAVAREEHIGELTLELSSQGMQPLR
ncbi:MAG: NUDIX hydrolase [Gammaproteobacteria bacterium]|nr:NUDIX hydrolase [Gammaproteobacteria bacterium]